MGRRGDRATVSRRAFLVTAALLPLVAAAPADVVALFGALAAALSNRDAWEFLGSFDPSMPGYGKLKSLVSALLEEAEVSSSVEILRDTGGEAKREVAVDWVLEVKSASLAGSFERRRREVKCAIERRKGRWVIVSLAPIEFFSPPSVAS
jgi:hypothetical protein